MENIGLSATWCRFVLNEGILPAMIARQIKNNDKNRQNIKLIASVLQKRENFKDVSYSEIVSMARTCFHNDPELTAWLSKIDSLLSVIIKFTDMQTDTKFCTSDLLDGAYVSFIKSCPLVSEDIKKEYLNTNEPGWVMTHIRAKNSSYIRKDEHPQKQEFMIYLRSLKDGDRDKYTKNTCNSYKSAINLASKLFEENLWEINDATEVKKRLDKHINTQNFIKADDGTHKSLSNGLRRYIEFLGSKNQ